MSPLRMLIPIIAVAVLAGAARADVSPETIHLAAAEIDARLDAHGKAHGRQHVARWQAGLLDGEMGHDGSGLRSDHSKEGGSHQWTRETAAADLGGCGGWDGLGVCERACSGWIRFGAVLAAGPVPRIGCGA